MLNWDYWYWQKGLKRRYSRPAARNNDLIVIERTENVANERIIGKISQRLDDMQDRLDASEDNITIPVMTAMQDLDSRLTCQINALQDAMELGNSAVLAELMRQKYVQIPAKEYPMLFKDKHRELLSILLSGKPMSFQEIREKMGGAKSSPRVYASELQRMGFPLTKDEKDGKVLVSIAESDKAAAIETAKRFDAGFMGCKD